MKNLSSVTEPSGSWNSYRGDEESFFYRDVICTFAKYWTSIPSQFQTYLTARLWERRRRCWKVSKLCLKFDAHAVSPPAYHTPPKECEELRVPCGTTQPFCTPERNATHRPSLSAHFIPLAWRDWSAVIIGNKKWHRNSRRRWTDRSIALISALYGVMVLSAS